VCVHAQSTAGCSPPHDAGSCYGALLENRLPQTPVLRVCTCAHAHKCSCRPPALHIPRGMDQKAPGTVDKTFAGSSTSCPLKQMTHKEF
jgi:hypothetical protein